LSLLLQSTLLLATAWLAPWSVQEVTQRPCLGVCVVAALRGCLLLLLLLLL
jgi:hypothetical protein